MIYLHVESHVQRGMHAVSGLFVCLFCGLGCQGKEEREYSQSVLSGV